ncbi:MAG: 1-deoxy-D-xylulose-5-phosphate reductoisomerase [Planctomycetota bacterium]|jgi:1-deoxy-D-xylulose-5-phosphate reductoisomerase
MSKRIAILGSTGSIGKRALNVIDALGPEYQVVALSADKNVALLAEQVRKYKPKFAALTNPDCYKEFCELVREVKVEVFCGAGGLVEIAEIEESDVVLVAVVGVAGLPAVLGSAKKGKQLAIANKESFVVAGELLKQTAKENNSTILPVDSEHSAIFQSMQAGSADEVSKLILTGSGGPLRGATADDIQKVTLKQALAHPVWNMGPKITIDSATMMNKSLEVIEAHWLFDMPVEKIEVLIHPESIVHSMVEFVDGSVIAQLGRPDMCMPIQYAITYPTRMAGIGKHLRLDKLGTLTFERPNMEVFRALKLGFNVAKEGGSAPVVFNAANEEAVEQFLEGRIKFANIIEFIEHCLDKHNVKKVESLEELFEVDKWARKEVAECLKQRI